MNGKYLILPETIYHSGYKPGEKFYVDPQNAVILKSGKPMESFENILYPDCSESKKLHDAFVELGDFEEEKGEFFSFITKRGERVFFYNSIVPIKKYEKTGIAFAEYLFPSRTEVLNDKILSYLNYTFSNNIAPIKNLVNTSTIKNKEEFIQNVGNFDFLGKLMERDEMLLKEIVFLGSGGFVGYCGKVYLYPFVEKKGRLQPIRFASSFTAFENVGEEIDKVETILAFQGKPKITLFFEKLVENTLSFKNEFISSDDLQKHVKESLDHSFLFGTSNA